LAQGAALLKLRPQRDDFGRLVAAAHVGLRPAGATMPVAGASVHAGVDADWLAQLEVGDRIDFKDARGARRCPMVLHTDETGALAACEQTAYLVPDTTLKHDHKGKKPRRTTLTELPRGEGLLHLQRGSVLRLTRAGAEPAAVPDRVRGRELATIPSVACTLPRCSPRSVSASASGSTTAASAV
jgi:pyruvate kinase